MLGWEQWKQGFEAWEKVTAPFLEKVLGSPLVLWPAGAAVTAAMRAKAASDRAMEAWWAGLGLPTRSDQERTLHALNQLQSRLLDLEERLPPEGP